jgi:hypothetical protein
LTIPHRGTTSESTYFITANVEPRRDLFQVEKIARLIIEVMLDYRHQKKYLLHEFVVMPDHFHLILTPTGITLERSMQLVKGGSPSSPESSVIGETAVLQILCRALQRQRLASAALRRISGTAMARVQECRAFFFQPQEFKVDAGFVPTQRAADFCGGLTAAIF